MIEILSAADVVLLRLAGDLDVTTASTVRDALDVAFDNGALDVVVDVTAVPLVDAAGVDVLADASCYARFIGGRLVVIDPRPGVVQVLAAAGHHDLLLDGATGTPPPRVVPRFLPWRQPRGAVRSAGGRPAPGPSDPPTPGRDRP